MDVSCLKSILTQLVNSIETLALPLKLPTSLLRLVPVPGLGIAFPSLHGTLLLLHQGPIQVPQAFMTPSGQ